VAYYGWARQEPVTAAREALLGGLGHEYGQIWLALDTTPDVDLPHEWLTALALADRGAPCIDGFSGEVLKGALCEARRMAGFFQRQTTRFWILWQSCLAARLSAPPP